MRKNDNAYSSYNEATKQLEMKLMSLNEAYGRTYKSSVFDSEKNKKTLEFLAGIDYTKDADAEAISKATVTVEGDPVDFIEECRSKLTELHTALANAEKQFKARLPWGEYDKAAIDRLGELGYAVHYYSVETKRFDEAWGTLYPLQVVKNDGKKVWFVTVAPKDEEYTFPVQEMQAPEGTLAELFATQQLKDKVNTRSTDAEVEKVLREEVQAAIDNSYNVLRNRIDRFGVVAPNIQKLEKDGRILVSYAKRDGGVEGEYAIFSSDNGKTWVDDRMIAPWVGWDIGYPSSVQLDDGRVMTVFYQANYPNHKPAIKYAIWDPAYKPRYNAYKE